MIRLYDKEDIKVFKELSKHLDFKEEKGLLVFKPKEGGEFFFDLTIKRDDKFNYKKRDDNYYVLYNKKANRPIIIKKTIINHLIKKYKFKNLKLGGK